MLRRLGVLSAPAPSDASPPPGRHARPRRAWLADAAAVLALLALVPLVHNVGPMLRAPFWLDESWVAMSARGSLRQAFDLTGPTPVGWTLLMRAIPGDGTERLRLLPLLFLAASVPAGYALGRLLGWDRRAYAVLAGLTGAAGALLLPAQQVRHDLKQYTADGAIAVALLALAAWAEAPRRGGRGWSRRRLTVFAACAVVAMYVSHPALLVGGTVLAAFVLIALLRRARENRRTARDQRTAPEGQGREERRTAREAPGRASEDLRRALSVAVAGWLAMAAGYLTVSRRGQIDSLDSYWNGFFLSLTGGPSLPGYLAARLGQLGDLFGVPWPVFALFAAGGVVTMAKTGRPVAAAAVAALPAGMVAAGYLHAYPVLDQRTSHFLLVTAAVSAGIGVAGAARLAARLAGRAGRSGHALATAVAVVLVAAYVLANTGWLRYYAPPGIYPRQPHAYADGYLRYDIRDQVRYVEGHRRAGDVVLVNSWGNFGFAYYWRADAPTFVRDTDFGNGWAAAYPESARIVVAAERERPALAEALSRAEALVAPGGRIWLVRTHVEAFELAGWLEALGGRRVEWIRVGPEPVGLVTPAPPHTRQ